MTIVEGFDSRSWDGFLSPEYQAILKYVGIKISQGQNWTPPEGYTTLPKQWRRAKKNYSLLRLPFHYWLPGWTWYNHADYGKKQAENFHQSIIDHFEGDFGELPPCIDVESRFTGMANGAGRALNLKACLDWTEDFWNVVPLIYTATWYWDRYMHTEFVKLVPEYWKKYDLWEADPLPNTTIAGWGDNNSIQQVVLDKEIKNFGLPGTSTKVDFDETTQAWLDKVTGSIPTPDDCVAEVAKAVAESEAKCSALVDAMKEQHQIEIGLAKKNAYNSGITDAKQAVKKLYKE